MCGIFCGFNRRIVQSVAAMRMTKTKTTRTTYSSDHGTTADWTCFQPSPPIFRRGNPSRTRATSRQIPAHATKISPRLRFFFFHLPLWLFVCFFKKDYSIFLLSFVYAFWHDCFVFPDQLIISPRQFPCTKTVLTSSDVSNKSYYILFWACDIIETKSDSLPFCSFQLRI